jgi:hypothetical protein
VQDLELLVVDGESLLLAAAFVVSVQPGRRELATVADLPVLEQLAEPAVRSGRCG